MIKTEYLNFDSINSINTSNDSFDSTFTLNQKYTKIKKIYLKNYEIPIGFSNIRSSNNSNVLRLILNGITYNCSINSGVYSSISSLITALNASIVTAINQLVLHFFYQLQLEIILLLLQLVVFQRIQLYKIHYQIF